MKKLTALLTVLSMVLCLFAGCGSTEKAPETTAPPRSCGDCRSGNESP